MRDLPDTVAWGSRETNEITNAANAEMDLAPDERSQLRSVRIDRVHSLWNTVDVGMVRDAIRSNRVSLASNEGPVVVRFQGNLYAANRESVARLTAQRFEGRINGRAHVIDLDRPAAPIPAPAPVVSAPLAVTKPKPPKLKLDVASVAHVAKELGIDEVDLAKVFHGQSEIPTKKSLERTWGHEESGTTINLTSSRVDRYNGTSVYMSGSIMREGRVIGRITRSFRKHPDGKLEVHHDFFRIDNPKDQGGGAAEAMLRQSIHTYEQAGVDEVTVDPHWVGQYTWATFGYQWSPSYARDMESDFSRYMIKHGVEEKRAKQIAKDVAPYPWELAAVDVDGIMVDTTYDSGSQKGKFKLGKSFLLGGDSWTGKIDLKDKNSPSYKCAAFRLGA